MGLTIDGFGYRGSLVGFVSVFFGPSIYLDDGPGTAFGMLLERVSR